LTPEILKASRPFIIGGYMVADEVQGSPQKEDFIILDIEHAKGKSSGLLTHKISKGSESSDHGRL
jgi:hypothetical protein